MVRSQIVQSFVARIWLERTADEDLKWRGHIQHIQGSEEIYFRNLTEMSGFMEQVSGISSLEFAPHPDKVVAFPKHRAASSKQRKTDK